MVQWIQKKLIIFIFIIHANYTIKVEKYVKIKYKGIKIKTYTVPFPSLWKQTKEIYMLLFSSILSSLHPNTPKENYFLSNSLLFPFSSFRLATTKQCYIHQYVKMTSMIRSRPITFELQI